MLLASDTGHFSIIRALHLADLITEMNGLSYVFLKFSSSTPVTANWLGSRVRPIPARL